MQARSRGARTFTTCLVAGLALGAAPGSRAGDAGPPVQPSAVERVVRQEDAHRAELGRFDAAARRRGAAAMLVTPDRSAATSIGPASRAGGDEFAWGAAAIGVCVGIAATCALLGLVALVRGDGRLRSI